eukprot:scaffold34553_cov51-Phaeocystis_antarctica.AAC.2
MVCVVRHFTIGRARGLQGARGVRAQLFMVRKPVCCCDTLIQARLFNTPGMKVNSTKVQPQQVPALTPPAFGSFPQRSVLQR